MSVAHHLENARTGRVGWLVVFAVAGTGVVSALQVGKAPIALSLIQSDLEANLVVASWVISAFSIVGATCGAPIGLAVDRLGAKRMVVGGLLLQALASGLGATAGGAGDLILWRVLEGFGFISVFVAAPTLIFAIPSPKLREWAIAIWATVMPVGMALAMLCAPLLSYLEWRGFWMLNAVLLLGYGLVSVASIPATTVGMKDRSVKEQLAQVAVAPGPWVLAALFAAFSTAFFAIFGFLPTLLQEQAGLSQNLAGVVSAISIAAGGIGNLASGFLLARWKRPTRVLTGGFLAMMGFSYGILAAGLAWQFVVSFSVLFSFMAGLVPVVLMTCLPRLAPRPELVGGTMGLAMQGNNVGMLVGPAMAGALAPSFGWGSVALAVAALLAAAIAVGQVWLPAKT
ncbi:MFS transporter [Pseudorhizobium halotolerans]|jgi:Arabinose efflux permease|uniref:MFS transporter n=1 Tax=Pseudorhizobium halotolerans TaxID=1233081 RepID=A0ABN7JTM9_9HYPH|nr:MFS transporter [Pseudorhizobium halotolerans]CAD7047666.1 MFS transporter [Pseudorhizobium halotolerans]